MENIKKGYFYLFYWLNNLFKHSADTYNEHKAAFVIMFIEALLITKIINLVSNNMILKDYTLVKIIAALTALIVAFFNYHILIQKKEWKKYEGAFKLLNSNQKFLSGLAIVTFIIFVVWFCYFS
ncbi:hypothetical protein [Dyadobacter frigoris]|uniref:Uncharacterized protein n=1 Tax=Dyadobacter frigoris TaxID=2576211 RepID=A0A4U6CXQ2_9BACT|nr:hypothetical protein [Dyadobacter frigoris]TKT88615.1 hypothetical protein FDK13_27100 [Dyadobacter frigoris]GLU54949.1 hypothetical protein Dfri01_44100 [Dyadobacter frigoris]